jgi:1-acyl-sn-glycerol-3-phosphate acyltransferase
MRPWYRLCRALCQALFLLVLRGRVFGSGHVPLRGGVILICNHQSFLDPVLATLALRRECHYMARDSLFRHPGLRRLIESLNAFPIRRGAADVGAVKETLRRLRSGALVTTFPEATRTPDGRIQEMSGGVLLIARRAGVPIVPTLILGAFESWPRRAPLPRPHPVVVAYGEALLPREMESMTDDEGIRVLRERILEMQRGLEGHPLLRHAARSRSRSGAPRLPSAVHGSV